MRCFVLLVLFAAGSCDAQAQSAKGKREAAYQARLHSYSDVLKPGMSRKNVEDYLRGKGVAFGQLCCIDEKSAFADLVYIGKEKHPWYCEKHNVFIAFQFAAVEPHKGWEAYDSDVLKSITVFHKFEGCL
ncbi:MAG TPA: hypothetical protein VMI32_14470 [Candidatus Solibacter sp.]|nr:hypothetical protein [Candidatus Solibacter sp.]